MNILNPKSWRFGSDDFRFQIGDVQPFNLKRVLKTSDMKKKLAGTNLLQDLFNIHRLLNHPNDLGPSNGRVLNLYSRGRVLKIASFEGPMILRAMVKWWFGLVIKASWMDESSLHSISFKKIRSPFMLHHLIQTSFIHLSHLGFVSGFQIWKTSPKNRNRFTTWKRNSENQTPGLEALETLDPISKSWANNTNGARSASCETIELWDTQGFLSGVPWNGTVRSLEISWIACLLLGAIFWTILGFFDLNHPELDLKPPNWGVTPRKV